MHLKQRWKPEGGACAACLTTGDGLTRSRCPQGLGPQRDETAVSAAISAGSDERQGIPPPPPLVRDAADSSPPKQSLPNRSLSSITCGDEKDSWW